MVKNLRMLLSHGFCNFLIQKRDLCMDYQVIGIAYYFMKRQHRFNMYLTGAPLQELLQRPSNVSLIYYLINKGDQFCMF